MKLDLRKIQYHENMSEETPCFSCEIWEDNILIGYCRNSGRGGSNLITRANNNIPHSQVMKYDNLDTECEIFELVYLDAEIKLYQTKNFVLYKDKDIYVIKFPKPISQLKKAPNYKSWLTQQVNKYRNDGYEVLNKNLGQI